METTTMKTKFFVSEEEFKKWYKKYEPSFSSVGYFFFDHFMAYKHIWYKDYIIWKLSQ